MSHVKEDVLILQLNQGNKKAFEQIYFKYSAKIYNFVLLGLYDKTSARDIVQSCFLILWEKRAFIDPEKNLSAYLFTIARNLVYKETERQVQAFRYMESAFPDLNEIDNETVESINALFFKEFVDSQLETLPPVSKEIFLLKKEEGLSTKEIAIRLNVSERAVEAHQYRTMKFLKEKLKEYLTILL
ncbi:MAG: sigma-70 family RNA polymerase sigma factor [Tannerellaceae bacterium]|nr:sigma-70 family RNA polymerase sigma factor [Tannerellaceae bacterium]